MRSTDRGCGISVVCGCPSPACRRTDIGTYTRVPQWPQRVRPDVVCDCHVAPHEGQFTVIRILKFYRFCGIFRAAWLTLGS